jgi:hypothetical protein
VNNFGILTLYVSVTVFNRLTISMSPELAHYLVENPNLAGFAIKPKKPLPRRKRLFGFERPTGLIFFIFWNTGGRV